MSDKINNQNKTLPANAQLLMNHCNLPAAIIGGLSYNEQPIPLYVDGAREFYKDLFIYLENVNTFNERINLFSKYMQAHFQLNNLVQMGQSDNARLNRKKQNYKRIILGWHMNPNGYEGAVLKRWIESRFGLTPRFHKQPIRDFYEPGYNDYLQTSALGIYNTNAIESQFDVLYSYTQYELNLIKKTHIILYRGINHLYEHEILEKQGKQLIILLNNINSFSHNSELAQQFGDYVIKIRVPIYKVFCYNSILPGQINSEEEYMVIGGLYRAQLI